MGVDINKYQVGMQMVEPSPLDIKFNTCNLVLCWFNISVSTTSAILPYTYQSWYNVTSGNTGASAYDLQILQKTLSGFYLSNMQSQNLGNFIAIGY